MSKVDFEFYPHIVDLIWEHITDPYTAGQVCTSWRKRALKLIYHHLSADMHNGRWRLWMKTDDEDIHCKYLLAGADTAPTLDSDAAARHTEILDVLWPRTWSGGSTTAKLAEKFPRLHTMRVHTKEYGDLKGIGETQVYSWFSRETSRVTIRAHEAQTLVVLIAVERAPLSDGLFDIEMRLSRQLLQACYDAKDLVVVFNPHPVAGAPRISSAPLARDVAEYLGVTCNSFNITVVGAESLLRDEVGGAYENFKSAVLRKLAARNSGHGVRFVTHEEYKAVVGRETYKLHCVPDVRWR
ncbi:hypothetical protein A1Q1_01163 [Trichosporon asahii var. asahii CBS 2479]|uniref:F-box domain-containing protein n=1 Tax=Trichosporon asahii var. asahii (strain ATCC 90039 / CBS 2479 / JCM 2466 / KCTC 7840 / NBRC 103889/ NCYC 2677 / UAMH 7654) TaxID=1186058 RepID=J4UEI1_TRIAS|nr:hypothetical protein A1Q1_01163 [Trichosporon asahii var. asahii CBS 2479]EJT49665.1 hypothetical protein A1Q1_01163 [Trichosporon asahii var. asahii CBS 2479]